MKNRDRPTSPLCSFPAALRGLRSALDLETVDRAEHGEEAHDLPVPGFVVAVPRSAPRREGLWSFAMLDPPSGG